MNAAIQKWMGDSKKIDYSILALSRASRPGDNFLETLDKNFGSQNVVERRGLSWLVEYIRLINSSCPAILIGMDKKHRSPNETYRFSFADSPVAIPTPKEGDARTFSGVAYSGRVIQQHWKWGNLIFDLSSTTVPSRLPILLGHDPAKIVGFLTSSSVGQDGLRISGALSKRTTAAAEVTALADEGFPWQMSVSIKPGRVERVQKNKTVEINGQAFQGPGTIFRDSVIREVSFVPVGADINTSATVMADQDQEQEEMAMQSDASTRPGSSRVPDQSVTAELEKFTEENATLRAEMKALREQMLADKQQRREAEIRQLFHDVGREFSADAAKPYLELSESSFLAVVKDMRAMRPAVDAASTLFSEQAVEGRDAAKMEQKLIDDWPA